jgi:hypothetical protein
VTPRKPALIRKANPLTEAERTAIVLAVQSAFSRLKNLYERIAPIFEEYGFRRPSAAVAARDISEKIEASIVQHCNTFEKGSGYADLNRLGQHWEVKICKGSGLTINQSKVIKGESYIVINYDADSRVTKVWVLWDAEDQFFTPRRQNSNARTIAQDAASPNVEVLFQAERAAATSRRAQIRALLEATDAARASPSKAK